MTAVVVGVAIMVVGTSALVALKCAGAWLARAISRDIHDGIGEVVREQLQALTESVTALDRRDARGQQHLLDRLNEVERSNTRDHGQVAARLTAVERRLAAVESRLSAPMSTTTIINEGGTQ